MTTDAGTRHQILQKHFELLATAMTSRRPEIVTWGEYQKAVPEDAPSDEVMDGLAQKALVIALKQKLDADPTLANRFPPQTKNPLWNQVLTAARIKELTAAKIVKKGGRKELRYDVADLAKTFYGKQLLTAAGLERQKVLDGPELDRLKAECAKVKLTLPESTEPTTTERFFDETLAPAPKAPPKKPRAKKAAAKGTTP